MKLAIFNQEKNKTGEKELPQQFKEEYRPDLIRRAVQALERASRQNPGSHPEAGKRSSSTVSKRRRDYRGCYGFGISRVNRKIHSRRGTRMFWVGAFTAQTVGGRRAHPPKAEKVRVQLINKKENRKAIRSAMAATLNQQIVAGRGHHVPVEYPFILDASFENLTKTKEVERILIHLGFEKELQRSSVKKVRAGMGKLRGRKYQRKKGILIVVGDNCPLLKAAKNIAGIDVIAAKTLNAKLLAPGAMPGRATLWTAKAIANIEQNKLFV
ncbi:MAG TPA: 50S ribosomal protein L4 [Candidatus Nanoarchaeia archaeon]|nr:50S ribosomal protein L4 [Candidatus Nanoarchaeia archaeon]